MKNIYSGFFTLMLTFIVNSSFAQNNTGDKEKPLDYHSILTIVDLNSTTDEGNADPLVTDSQSNSHKIEGRDVTVDSNGIQSLAIPPATKQKESPAENKNSVSPK